MNFSQNICGEKINFKDPAEFVAICKGHMEKADIAAKELEQKAKTDYDDAKKKLDAVYNEGIQKIKADYKPAIQKAEAARKRYFVFRKAVAQFSGKPVSDTPVKPTTGPESKANVG